MSEDYLSVLWNEFFAEEGSFLLQLRVALYWDREAFERLINAMVLCCKHYEQEQSTEEQRMQAIQVPLPRWLASGFWLLSREVRVLTDTRHHYWEKEIAREPDYYNKAYERLDYLALWFFEGENYESG